MSVIDLPSCSEDYESLAKTKSNRRSFCMIAFASGWCRIDYADKVDCVVPSVLHSRCEETVFKYEEARGTHSLEEVS